jgi:hypothetical protein
VDGGVAGGVDVVVVVVVVVDVDVVVGADVVGAVDGFPALASGATTPSEQAAAIVTRKAARATRGRRLPDVQNSAFRLNARAPAGANVFAIPVSFFGSANRHSRSG